MPRASFTPNYNSNTHSHFWRQQAEGDGLEYMGKTDGGGGRGMRRRKFTQLCAEGQSADWTAPQDAEVPAVLLKKAKQQLNMQSWCPSHSWITAKQSFTINDKPQFLLLTKPVFCLFVCCCCVCACVHLRVCTEFQQDNLNRISHSLDSDKLTFSIPYANILQAK